MNHGYETLGQVVARKAPPWKRRSPTLLWRGSTTGYGALWSNDMSPANESLRPRIRAALLLRDVHGADVRFTRTVQTRSPSSGQRALRRYGLVGRPRRLSAWFGHRYALDIDGNSNAWSNLYCRLLIGCCVLKVESAGQYEQWYYPQLVPGVH